MKNAVDPRFKSVFENMNHMVYISDPEDYTVLYANKIAKEMLSEELEGFKCFKAIQNLDSPCSFCTNEILFGKNPISPYIWTHYNEKVKRWYTCIDQSIDWGEGKKVRLELALDVTERTEMETKLRESEKRYRDIIENTKDAIIVFKIDGKVNYISPQLTSILGIEKKELMKKFLRFIHPKDFILITNSFKNVIESILTKMEYEHRDLEFRAQHKDGHYVWLSSTANNYYDDDGNVSGFITSLRDISEKKEAEQKLKESEQKYRDLFNQADLFKDIVAHDINNILSNINSAIQLSNLYKDDSKQMMEMNDLIKDQVLRGQKLISNVRKISQFDELEASIEEIDISIILEESIHFIRQSFKNKELKIIIDEGEKRNLCLANNLLLDVFENIMLNSVKFNVNKEIEIEIIVSKIMEDEVNYIKMEFIDNGFGINDELKDSIFSREYREDISIKGMGLGLSLVKKSIESYYGKIWVEDRVKGDHSKGSNFILLIPEA